MHELFRSGMIVAGKISSRFEYTFVKPYTESHSFQGSNSSLKTIAPIYGTSRGNNGNSAASIYSRWLNGQNFHIR